MRFRQPVIAGVVCGVIVGFVGWGYEYVAVMNGLSPTLAAGTVFDKVFLVSLPWSRAVLALMHKVGSTLQIDDHLARFFVYSMPLVSGALWGLLLGVVAAAHRGLGRGRSAARTRLGDGTL